MSRSVFDGRPFSVMGRDWDCLESFGEETVLDLGLSISTGGMGSSVGIILFVFSLFVRFVMYESDRVKGTTFEINVLSNELDLEWIVICSISVSINLSLRTKCNCCRSWNVVLSLLANLRLFVLICGA